MNKKRKNSKRAIPELQQFDTKIEISSIKVFNNEEKITPEALCPICGRTIDKDLVAEGKCMICFIYETFWTMTIPRIEELRQKFFDITTDPDELRRLTAVMFILYENYFHKKNPLPQKILEEELMNADLMHLFPKIVENLLKASLDFEVFDPLFLPFGN